MSEQALARRQAAVRVYDRAAPLYDQVGPRFYARFGQRLIELAQLATDARVLDVASGRGALLFPAATQTQRGGRVIGSDLSLPMAQATNAQIKNRAVANAAMLQMNGQALAFPDACFDNVLCGFAIFWFTDIQRALGEFQRVLRSQGRVGISMSGGADPRWQWYHDLLVQYDEQHHIFEDTGRHMNGKPDELVSALAQAGLLDIQIAVETFDVIYANAEEWWASLWTHGSRLPLEKMTPAVLKQFQRDAFVGILALKQADGFHEAWRVALAFATKP